MWFTCVSLATRLRLFTQSFLVRLGFRDESFLVIVAVVIGVLASAAAVAFHELVVLVRTRLYHDLGSTLYERWLWLLVLWPALGGLLVGILSRWVFRAREGHGVIDVIESVHRSSGFVKPLSAIEKILTSGITIGSGGSSGAEGPIVQIGAAISSAVGSLFAITRQHMPVVVGCGTAAGISAIFNAPIGGLLFTLEVILQDYSLRTLTALVVASVVANVTTQAIYRFVHEGASNGRAYDAIFRVPDWALGQYKDIFVPQLAAFATLGVACGLLAVVLTKSMFWSEAWFGKRPWPKVLKPAIGGAMLGLMGVGYVFVYRRVAGGGPKPIPMDAYALPAFFSDGYGAIQQLLGPDFYARHGPLFVCGLLATWLVLKIAGTCASISSGGSGGVIAPALFVGASGGGLVGTVLAWLSGSAGVKPELYALLGMAGVLAAVVHAPLASILILMETTGDSSLVLPAMLTAVVATSVARVILPDSIYSHALRERGVQVGSGTDLLLLRRMSLQQVGLEPANLVAVDASVERLLAAVTDGTSGNFVAIHPDGSYAGIVSDGNLRAALLERQASSFLLVQDVMRADILPVLTNDDLASVMDRFSSSNLDCLPVAVNRTSRKIVGVISRAALMKAYRGAVKAEG